MIREVRWSIEARTDLADQLAYIAADNPREAYRMADVIEKAARDLGDMPTGRPGRITGTYEKVLTSHSYIIAYEIVLNGETETVMILRVIHTSRDWSRDRWPS